MRETVLLPITLALALAGGTGASDNVPEGKSLTEQHKDLLPTLIEALKDKDKETQMMVEEAIIALGAEAVPGLIEAVDGKDTELRVPAAKLLGRMANEAGYPAKEAIPSLIKALKDQEASVRQASAFALARILQRSRPQRGFGGGGGGGGF